MNQGSIRCNVFQEPTHLTKRVCHVVPGVVVNLSWAGWVIKIKGVDINWDASPVSSPAAELIHLCEVN